MPATPARSRVRRRARVNTLLDTNKSGQALGAKGRQTRDRIISATEKLLNTTRMRDITVALIAKTTKIATATFYLYFSDVEEAAAAVVERIDLELAGVQSLLTEDWPDDEVFARAKNFIDTYVKQWAKHAAALRMRNFAAEEGDPRFLTLRKDVALPMIEAFARKLTTVKAHNGAASIDRYSIARLMVIALERLTAASVINQYANPDVNREEIADALAYVVELVVREARQSSQATAPVVEALVHGSGTEEGQVGRRRRVARTGTGGR